MLFGFMSNLMPFKWRRPFPRVGGV